MFITYLNTLISQPPWQIDWGHIISSAAAAAAKSLQSCPTLCDPIDGSPPDSPVPGILQARTLEWVAISSPVHESEKWKGSRSVVSDSSRPHGLQPTGLLCAWDFPGKSAGVGCHCFLQADYCVVSNNTQNFFPSPLLLSVCLFLSLLWASFMQPKLGLLVPQNLCFKVFRERRSGICTS